MPITCKSCGHENRMDAAYCGSCAWPLTDSIECPQCKAGNPWPQNYCNFCGAPLMQGRPAPSTPVERPVISPPVSAKPGGPIPAVRPPAVASTAPGAAAAPPAERFSYDANFIGTAAAVAVLVSILAFTRLWDLGTTPPVIVPGEVAFIEVARQIELGAEIGLSHDLISGSSTAYAYVLALWTNLAGDGIGMARLLSGIASIASVGVTYLLAATLFNRRAALIATLLMAVGVLPLTYARLALPTSLLLLVEASALYLLFRAFRAAEGAPSRLPLLVASGALVGLGLYLDFAGIVFAAAALCLWLREYLSGRVDPRVLGKRFAAFAVAALVVGMPFWTAALADSPTRDGVSALLITQTPRYLESDGVMGQLRMATGSVVDTARSLVWSASADESGQGGGRMVDPFTGLLVLVGLLVCVRRWREDSPGALLVLCVVLAVGVGLTRQEGMFARLIIAAPVIFTLAGYAVDWLLTWLKGRAPTPAIIALLAVLAAGVIALNLTTYYAHPTGKEPSLWTGTHIEHPPPSHPVAQKSP